MKEARELGRHIIAEFMGCPQEVLDDLELLKKVLIEAANRSGSQVVTDTFFKFKPQGVSGVVVIKESKEKLNPSHVSVLEVRRGVDVGGRKQRQ